MHQLSLHRKGPKASKFEAVFASERSERFLEFISESHSSILSKLPDLTQTGITEIEIWGMTYRVTVGGPEMAEQDRAGDQEIIWFTDNTNGQCQVRLHEGGKYRMWDDGTDPVDFQIPAADQWPELIEGYYDSYAELLDAAGGDLQAVKDTVAEIVFETNHSDDDYESWS